MNGMIVDVDKENLISTLTGNLVVHRKAYAEALEACRNAAVAEPRANADEIESGEDSQCVA